MFELYYHRAKIRGEEGYLEPATSPPECGCLYQLNGIPMLEYSCTRPAGHEPPHAAHGTQDQQFCIWD